MGTQISPGARLGRYESARKLGAGGDKTHVWGEQYNRRATDVLQVQSEIFWALIRRSTVRSDSRFKDLMRRVGLTVSEGS